MHQDDSHANFYTRSNQHEHPLLFPMTFVDDKQTNLPISSQADTVPQGRTQHTHVTIFDRVLLLQKQSPFTCMNGDTDHNLQVEPDTFLWEWKLKPLKVVRGNDMSLKK